MLSIISAVYSEKAIADFHDQVMSEVERSRSRSPPGRFSIRTVAAGAPMPESIAELLAQLEEVLAELEQSALLVSTEVLAVAVPNGHPSSSCRS